MAATVRQIQLLETLIRERTIPQDAIDAAWTLFRKPEAACGRGGPISKVIDAFMTAPRKGAAAAPAAAARGRGNSLVERDIQCSKYAIPAGMLPASLEGLVGANDHLFVEVKEFTPPGKSPVRYLRKLQGAPGSFERIRVPAPVKDELARILEGHTLEYTQLFGELYSCCGQCGAELTDAESRRLKLGPDCRKRFGL